MIKNTWISLGRAVALAGLMMTAASCSESATPAAETASHSYSQEKAASAGLRPVTDNFAVAPQIQVSDLTRIKEAGFTRIINHRPDGEGAGQPRAADIAAEAERLGLTFVNLPFRSGHVTDAAFDGLISELADSDEPTLSYCRSGTRAVTIWSMAQVKAGELTPDQAIAAAGHAGYRLQGQKRTLEQLAAGN
jgi:uncharacterized protein (TIGR01244 family)